MGSFTTWLNEMARGVTNQEDTIFRIIGLAVTRHMNPEMITQLLNSEGENISARSVARILSRYGLTGVNRQSIFTTAQDQMSKSMHGKTAFPAHLRGNPPPLSKKNTSDISIDLNQPHPWRQPEYNPPESSFTPPNPKLAPTPQSSILKKRLAV